MSTDLAPAPPRGVVTVRTRALEHVLRALVRDALGGRATDVDVRLRDDGGRLALWAQAPLVPPLSSTLLADLHRDRATIARRFAELTGREVSGVDLRVTGLREPVTAPRVT